jgi:hypothetical protein
MRTDRLTVSLERHPWHLEVVSARQAADAITPEQVR